MCGKDFEVQRGEIGKPFRILDATQMMRSLSTSTETHVHSFEEVGVGDLVGAIEKEVEKI
jgi:hypothetical protein